MTEQEEKEYLAHEGNRNDYNPSTERCPAGLKQSRHRGSRQRTSKRPEVSKRTELR